MTMRKQAVLFLPRVCACVYTCMYAILVEQGRTEQRREILPSPRLAQAAVEAETNISEHLLCAQGTTDPSPSQPRTQLFSSGYQLCCCPGENGDSDKSPVRPRSHGWWTQSPDGNLGLGLSSKAQRLRTQRSRPTPPGASLSI